MIGDNTPTEFELTAENYLDVLLEWLPDHLHNMRQFISGDIKVDCGMSTIECQYMPTVGGEKFRVVDQTYMGASGSVYFAPLGNDDDVIMEIAKRVENAMKSQQKIQKTFKNKEEVISLKMKFMPGPFAAKQEPSVRMMK